MSNRPAPVNVFRWFNPRNRQIGTWGFILNRITAIGLTLYLFMHLAALGQLARGPQAYDGFIALVKHPMFKMGELLVIAAGLIHGLNGIRITLTSFGIGTRYERIMFLIAMLLAAVGILFFGYRMFIVD